MTDRQYLANTAALLAARAVRADLNQHSGVAAEDADTLHRIATRLHRASERECNEDLTCPKCGGDGTLPRGAGITPAPGRFERRDCPACAGHGTTLGRRIDKNRKSGAAIASKYGLRVYWQTDPRGCPLYLIPEDRFPTDREALEKDYRYPSDSAPVLPLATLQARWLDSWYNSAGAAVCHLGR